MMEVNEIITILRNKFNVSCDFDVITVSNGTVEVYGRTETENNFGELLSLLYIVDFTIFHSEFNAKILALAYPNYHQILKLDIKICDGLVEQELSYCRNFLQRKRNLNLMFEIFTKCAYLVEARRHICQVILKDNPLILLEYESCDGLLISCTDQKTKRLLYKCRWKVEFKVDDYFVQDVIHFHSVCIDQRYLTRILPIFERIEQSKEAVQIKCTNWRLLMHKTSHYLAELNRSRTEVVAISDDEDEIEEVVFGPAITNSSVTVVVD